jgi:hypothetical protein
LAKKGLDLEKLGQKAWEPPLFRRFRSFPKAVGGIGLTSMGGVARKWRRNGLKRLNPRPEMVGLGNLEPTRCGTRAQADRAPLRLTGLEKDEVAEKGA